MAFKAIDYYNIDELLGDSELLIRDTVRSLMEDKYQPAIAKHFNDGTCPLEIAKDLGELNAFGVNLEGYGCAGSSDTAYGLINQELERVDSALRSFSSVQTSLSMYPIHRWGSGEQKERYLPGMAKGEIIGCFGLTEPDHGSDPSGMKTTAQKTDSGYIINGSKMWITNGTIADIAVVWAKLDGEIRGFLVEKGTDGYTAPEIKNKFSLRASVTSELSFLDCEIPKENILPDAVGLKAPLSCLTQARYGIAWGVIGAAMACFDEALQYAQERIQFGKPIAAFQLQQEKFAYMATEITKMQLLCLRLGQLKDAGKATHTQVSMAKRNNVAEALKIAGMARGILGAAGIVDEYSAMRHACNLESVYTYEGTHDIHTLILGHDITGFKAYR
ncbi:acyl-CoA dehydrogenase family protein [bacterium]|nr:acyl-CoA dehydrogenase family protein [bacterium]